MRTPTSSTDERSRSLPVLLLGVLWIGLVLWGGWLVFSLGRDQADVARSMAWWRDAGRLADDLSEVARVAAQDREAHELTEHLPASVQDELENGRLLRSVPLESPMTYAALQQWDDRQGIVRSSLQALRENPDLSADGVLESAADLAVAVDGARTVVSGDLFGRVEALNARRTTLYVLAAFALLAAGAGFWLTLHERRQRAALIESGRKLRESEARYRSMFRDNSAIQILVHPGTRRVVDANQAALDFYGTDMVQLTQTRISDLLASSADVVALRGDEAFAADGTPILYRHRRFDGQTRDIELRASNIEVGGRSMQYCIIHDVTERHRAEVLLRDNEARLRATLRSLSDGVIATDLEGTITLANEAALRMTGVTEERAIGEALTKLYRIRAAGTGATQEDRLRALHAGEERDAPPRLKLMQRMGGERTIEEAHAPLTDASGNQVGVVFALRDVTEQAELEETVQRQERLDSLGVLAGGIAHDFNNILAGVLGNFSLALPQLDESSPARERLLKAEEASKRARGLCQQLLTISRGGQPVRRSASLQEIINEAVDFGLRGSNVRAEVRLAADLSPAYADSGQIHQVFHNLVINADHAMRDGGTLTITGENEHVSADNLQGLRSGDYVHIRVKDTGVGIPEEALSRVFDPYFTTKASGHGLGLSSCWSIVRNHEGALTVASIEGEGATFHIWLPVAEDGMSSDPTPEPENTTPVRKGARVLLMDDDVTVRELTAFMLERAGYEAVTAMHGEEAVERHAQARESGRPFDFVILDLTVPGGMGGRDCMQVLTHRDPALPGFIMSGYTNDPVLASPRLYGFVGALAKPFTAEELARTIRSALTSEEA